jgi:hypothetical protein
VIRKLLGKAFGGTLVSDFYELNSFRRFQEAN